jgi:uncharacterized protein YcfJ
MVSHVPIAQEKVMKKIVMSAFAITMLTVPMAAHAQSGAAAGATTGAVTGAVVGGPVGAAVGAGAGAIAGGIAEDTRPRFRSYVSERRVPSYRYEREVKVGADLPKTGVTYYDVPKEYGVTKYRYTVVNDQTVLVDPGTHRIVQIIE